MQRGQHIFTIGCVLLALCISVSGSGRAQTVDELYAEGVKARLEQRFDAAADRLQRVLALQPKNTDALVQLGFVELARGNLAAARRYFSDTLVLAPTYLDASFGLAQIEFRNGNLDAARALVEPVVKQQPDNKDAAALLHSILEASKAKEEADRARMKAQTIARLMEQGRKQRIQGRFSEAERSYRKVIGLDPRNGDALVALGLVAGAQGKYPEAEKYFDRALALGSRNLDAHLGKIRLALWQNDTTKARLLLNRIRAPRNAEVILLEGRVAFIEEDYGRAELAFRTALKLNSSDADALIGLGDVMSANGDGRSARLLYEQASKLRPGSPEIISRLSAPMPTKWRFDLASEISDLSGGQGTWTDSVTSLSYRAGPRVTLASQARVATRFGETDEQLQTRLDYSPRRPFSVYGLVALAPEADFLADYSLGVGGTWAIETGKHLVSAVVFGMDLRYDEFTESEIWLAEPSAQIIFLNERFSLTGRWVHVEDDNSNTVNGFIVRGDLRVADSLQSFVGYSDAPEISEGVISDTETVFGGVVVDVAENVALRASYAYETRTAFNRDIFALGITVRF